MKVGVLGAGAVGSMFGGLLQHHAPDVEVLLVARGPHGEAMRNQGSVHLQGSWGTTIVPIQVSENVADLAGSDYILLTVKSHATEMTIRQALDHIEAARVVSIQNGVNQQILSKYVSPSRLFMGMTATSIIVPTPGTVTMKRNAATVIGPTGPDPRREELEAVAALLRRTQLKIVTDPHIVGAQYNKLIFNTLGAASSLSGSDFISESILHSAWRNKVALPLQQESLDVLETSGVQIGRIPGAPDVYRFRRLMRLLNNPLVGPLIGAAIRAFFNRRSIRFSLAADLQEGKRTEVDFINGEIVRLARSHDIDAPYNAKVVALVHQLEQQGGRMTREEVIDVFRSIPR